MSSGLSTTTIDANSALLTPSLCHPHLHLDKAFLLSHPKHSHLQLQRGDFKEAMDLTSQAKAAFTPSDLLERGARTLDESITAGVTHMRAFVEIDAGVGNKCLEAGLKLKKEYEGRVWVQICAFAQLPLFTSSPNDERGEVIRSLMEEAAANDEVEALGSTPYVEGDRVRTELNIDYMIRLTASRKKHLDFHLDYNLDLASEPSIWHVLSSLRTHDWTKKTGDPNTTETRTVVLGHCTRLTLFTVQEWQRLASEITSNNLPVSFVGLPTSDMFMMKPSPKDMLHCGYTRGTLPVLRMVDDYGLNACMGINNIGNAFTPQGSCDPLLLACNGVAVYQAGTVGAVERLFEGISTRARQAIGLQQAGKTGSGLEVGDPADLLLFGSDAHSGWRTRRSVAEAAYLYDHCQGRRAWLDGRITSG
ncbi:Metallo-dependent hydrolase [Polychaeton citri CBS 116435]|uniref:Metallo-dependent hydrolase n=1 Tax=Polychaeton citri CBS 116435 TaxID=1314669 RepID=A0A9P4Q9D2_9PEZI|nr:Metallo-dependent hydrolase [Polychaeton citri CBS 116435]